MKFGILSLIYLALLGLQISLIPHLAVYGVVPSLLLVMTVSYAVLLGNPYGLLAGLLAGALLDLTAGQMIGLRLVLYTGIAGLAGTLEPHFFKHSAVLAIIGSFLATALVEASLAGVMQLLGWPVTWNLVWREQVVIGGLYNAVLAWLVYRGLYRLYPRLRPDPRGSIDDYRWR